MVDWAGEGYEVVFWKNVGLGVSCWEGRKAEIKVGLGNSTFELILKKCKNENDADGL